MENLLEQKAEKFREIWDTLSKVDVSEFKETKIELVISVGVEHGSALREVSEAEYEFSVN